MNPPSGLLSELVRNAILSIYLSVILLVTSDSCVCVCVCEYPMVWLS